MKDLPSWFNASEYSDFLTEAVSLFEFNLPYWKKRRQIQARNRQERRTEAIQDGRARAQQASELAQAKADGIMRGMGENFKSDLENKFLKLLEAKNPLKQAKRKMRPEVDPADRDRDRKREDRREANQSPLSNILIVRNKNIGKIEIIMKTDFNSESHQVLKGRVKNIDKGPISKSDLLKASKSAEFMNTKTSMKLIGKVEKTNEGEPGVNDQGQEVVDTGGGQMGGATPPPPPAPRAPTDGKEITDPASTYPDWDHDTTSLAAGIAYGINPQQEMPPEFTQMMSVSRTLGDSVNRAINELVNTSPELSQMSFQLLPPVLNTGPNWGKQFGIPQSTPNATIIGLAPEQQTGISIKVGEQIRPGVKNEAGIILSSLINSPEGEKTIYVFDLMLQDFFTDLRDLFMNSLPLIDREEKYKKGASLTLTKERRKKETYERGKNIFKNRAKNLVEDFINRDEDLKSAFILESITGNKKFEGGLGSAQMLINVNKDGTDARLIPLDSDFAFTLGKSHDTHLSLKFKDVSPDENNFMESLYQKLIPLNESAIEIITELERIKGELANPLVFLQLFNIELLDAVYQSPIDYSKYYEGDSDADNVIILNPNSNDEEEIRIPVKKVFSPTGKEENRIELGIDQIFEGYLLMNDYLTKMVSSNQMSLNEATEILSEEFNFLTEGKKKKKKKRNYRKEYDEYHGTAEQRANRSKRVLARRKMKKKGLVRKGDGKDVDHKNGNPQDNSDKNLRVLPKSKNRSIKEDHGGGFEGTPELLQKFIKDTPDATETPVLFGSRPYPESKMKKKKK